MGVTNVTLRVNSYQNRNTIIVGNEVLRGSNKTEYCKRKPILDCFEDFFQAVHSELNNSYNLTVCGNVFEKALLRAAAQQYRGVNAFADGSHSINWSTRGRLSYLKKLLGDSVHSLSVPVVFGGTISIAQPNYPMVSFSSSNRRKLIVSDNLFDIENCFNFEDCENVAFLVDGKQGLQSYGDKYILSCSASEVAALVAGYLETKYINPFIGELVSKYRDRLEVQRVPAAFLLDQIEPYFFLEENSKEIQIFPEEECNIGIHSISLSESGKIAIDADLHRLTSVRSEENSEDGASATARMDVTDIRHVYGVRPGRCKISYYFEDTEPLFSSVITVVGHKYINTISSELLESGRRIKRWRIGEKYDIHTSSQPGDAEDADNITYTSSNPRVAKVCGNQVQILKEGAFTLTTTALKVHHEQEYYVGDAIVRDVRVVGWPNDNTIQKGDSILAEPSIEPKAANWSGFSYTVTKGGKHIDIIDHGQHGISIIGKSVGTCTIVFRSQDNPEVQCIKELKIVPPPHTYWQKAKTGLILFLIASLILRINPESVPLTLVFVLPAILNFVLAAVRREQYLKITIIASVLIYCFHLLPLAIPETSKAPEKSLNLLLAESKAAVMSTYYTEEVYFDDDIQWKPNTASYVGYCLNQQTRTFYQFVFAPHSRTYEIHFIYEVGLVHPSIDSTRTVFASVTYSGDSTLDYFDVNYSKKKDVLSADSFDGLRQEYDGVEVETNIPDDVIYSLYGWDNYVDSAEDISFSDLEYLVQLCCQESGLNEEDVAIGAVWLDLADNVYSNRRNKLYIFLRKNNLDTATGELTTYYFPFVFDNLKTAIDDNGNTIINREQIDLSEQEYILSLEESEAYNKDGLINLTP